MSSTTIVAIEVTLNLPLLHTLIKREAKAAVYMAMVALTGDAFDDDQKEITEEF